MKPNLIQKRDIRTIKRKQAKQQLDSIINLSVKAESDTKKALLSTKVSEGTVRLLDEGAVVDSEGYPVFIIKRNTIQEYYDNLSDEYVGSVNIGHLGFSQFPFLVGEWTKRDLTIVDIGDGRKGLDVRLNLDSDSLFIQELKRKDYPIGISSEFSYSLDETASDEYGLEIIDHINITDFAIVGEAGNVNSSEIKLKGDVTMSDKKQTFLEKLTMKYFPKENEKQLQVEKPTEVKKQGENEESTEAEMMMLAIMEKVASLEKENSEMLSVMEVMDQENKRLATELSEAQKELGTKSAVQDETFKKFKELAASYLDTETEKKKQLEGKDHQEQPKITNEVWGI